MEDEAEERKRTATRKKQSKAMKRHVLLVHPKFPTTYWGFQESLALVGKKASLPPLGLVTLAAYLPDEWELRLLDLNIGPLTDRDLRWADAVLTGGMLIQKDSMQTVTDRAHRLGRPVVVGGPAPTTSPELFTGADLVVQGEIEDRPTELVEAITALWDRERNCSVPEILAAPQGHPDMAKARVPRFDLLEIRNYTSMSIQYSRGCPFNCEFCDIVEIFGHASRVKTDEQILAELDLLYELGFVGSIFFVDDNFIGNKKAVRHLLPKIARWQEERGRPFDFYTEASINLAKDPKLTEAMIQAGFRSVFVGIETPSAEALAEAGKKQNLALDLNEAIATLTRAGLEVMGGFIVGFDSDKEDIFEIQRAFIQSNPIPLAMIGVLIALPGTALWRRLEAEGRLRGHTLGDQFGRANFVPTMDERMLLAGYRRLLADIYNPEAYYERCEHYVRQAGPIPTSGWAGMSDIKDFLKMLYKIGLRSPRRRHFWRLLRVAAQSGPHSVKWAVVHAIQGEHMIRYTQEEVLPRLDRTLALMDKEQERVSEKPRKTRTLATERKQPEVIAFPGRAAWQTH